MRCCCKRLLSNTWYMTRFTSFLMVPLTMWFLLGMADLANVLSATFSTRNIIPGSAPTSLALWLDQGWNVYLLAAFVIVLGYHCCLHMVEVWEDYIKCDARRHVLIWLTRVWVWGSVVVALYAMFNL